MVRYAFSSMIPWNVSLFVQKVRLVALGSPSDLVVEQPGLFDFGNPISLVPDHMDRAVPLRGGRESHKSSWGCYPFSRSRLAS